MIGCNTCELDPNAGCVKRLILALNILFSQGWKHDIAREMLRDLVINSKGKCLLACHACADCMWYGVGGSISIKRATQLYAIGANNGSMGCAAILQTIMSESKDCCAKNEVCMTASYINELAHLYLYKSWFIRDAGRAFALTKYGVTLENSLACVFMMGYLKLRGWGTKKNRAAATQWFKIGAARGHAPSCEMLAEAYWKGYGVYCDEVMAISYHNLCTHLRGELGELNSKKWANRITQGAFSFVEYKRIDKQTSQLVDQLSTLQKENFNEPANALSVEHQDMCCEWKKVPSIVIVKQLQRFNYVLDSDNDDNTNDNYESPYSPYSPDFYSYWS